MGRKRQSDGREILIEKIKEKQNYIESDVIKNEASARRTSARRTSERRTSERSVKRGSDSGQKNMEEKRGNRQILAITYIFVAIFLGMAAYLVNFIVKDSDTVINNPYNKRQKLLAERVVRGEIYSADGKVLAKTETLDGGEEKRVYPYGDIFCHAVGRTANSMTGVELAQCYPLLTSHANPFLQLTNTFRGEKNPGDNVYTTLDSKLQETAYNALGEHKGAVVALEPSTGKILAMVSKPDYNPNTVEKYWDSLIDDSKEDSALVNRATQGLYPPGSTFKLLTTLEYIRENPKKYKSYVYDCSGSDSFEGNVINCYGHEHHGRVNLGQSLAKSCNGSFAAIGTKLDKKSYRNLCEKFLFNKELPVKFEYNKSKFELNAKSDTGEVVQTAIGQGKTMITPLQNAMITATIANKGEMMVPYVIDHTENTAEQVVKSYAPVSAGKIINQKTAKIMGDFMKSVVSEGTASSLSDLSYKAAGKTGSAEFDSQGASHAWFVGYAPAKNPKIVVSIVVEGAGTGSQYAVPIAKKLFQEYIGY